MSSSTHLEAYRNIVQRQILPAYEPLDQLTLVYLLGSLVSGYTGDADPDIMMVWDDACVPAASLREALVTRLDERHGVSPFVVDYRDIHLERYDRQPGIQCRASDADLVRDHAPVYPGWEAR